MSKFAKRILSLVLTAVMALSLCPSALAAENPPTVVPEENHIIFHNISQMAAGEYVQYTLTDAAGNEAAVGIEKVAQRTRAGGETWQVWYKAIGVHVEFYMTVSNNKVTSVYDYSISLVGSSYEDAVLSKTATYGKLTFTHKSALGLSAATCWLKGTVTGEDDQIDVTWQM